MYCGNQGVLSTGTIRCTASEGLKLRNLPCLAPDAIEDDTARLQHTCWCLPLPLEPWTALGPTNSEERRFHLSRLHYILHGLYPKHCLVNSVHSEHVVSEERSKVLDPLAALGCSPWLLFGKTYCKHTVPPCTARSSLCSGDEMESVLCRRHARGALKEIVDPRELVGVSSDALHLAREETYAASRLRP